MFTRLRTPHPATKKVNQSTLPEPLLEAAKGRIAKNRKRGKTA
jgi:hypothetical protein